MSEKEIPEHKIYFDKAIKRFRWKVNEKGNEAVSEGFLTYAECAADFLRTFASEEDYVAARDASDLMKKIITKLTEKKKPS